MLLTLLHFMIWLLPFIIVGFSKKKTLESLLGYFLIINVGVQGTVSGLMLLFWGKTIAHYLGWAWSPFALVASYASLSFGVLGLLCHWRRNFDFWMATTLSYSLYLTLTFFNHIHLIIASQGQVKYGHVSPLIYLDLLTPLTLLILFCLYGKKKRSWFQ